MVSTALLVQIFRECVKVLFTKLVHNVMHRKYRHGVGGDLYRYYKFSCPTPETTTQQRTINHFHLL